MKLSDTYLNPIAYFTVVSNLELYILIAGIPVACMFLPFQAQAVFNSEFPGLEISPVYLDDTKGFTCEEFGGLLGFYPTSTVVSIPVYERKSAIEEARMGTNGIRKVAVGSLRISGDCK